MKAIAAMSLNRVIGSNGKIPWHLPEDFKWFKKTTMGGNLLMGRKTFDSIGKALPGRMTYVLTSDPVKNRLPRHENMMYVSDISNIPSSPTQEFLNKTWICGGSTVYKKFIPQCSEVLLTLVLDEYDGDTEMPEFEHLFPNSEILRETKNFWIIRYWK